MNPTETDGISSWGIFQWASTFIAGIAIPMITGIYRKMSSNEALIRKVEKELNDKINDVSDKATEGRDELRREIQHTLQAITVRLDQTSTKQDLIDIVTLAITGNSKK